MATAFSGHGAKRKVADIDKYQAIYGKAPHKRAKVSFGWNSNSIEDNRAQMEAQDEFVVPSTASRRNYVQIALTPGNLKTSASVPTRASKDPQTTLKTTYLTAKQLREKRRADQDIFAIHCRDNIFPGSAGPKRWEDVTTEFNERFKDFLPAPLMISSVQKRGAGARKKYLEDNPDYPVTVSYPCQVSVSEYGKNYYRMEVDSVVPQAFRYIQYLEEERTEHREQRAQQKAISANDVNWVKDHPGAELDPSTVPLKKIYPIDQAKYFLHRRATDTATFYFLDPYEAEITEFDPQTMNHKTMRKFSPRYRDLKFSDHSRPIDVPKKFGSRTVNAFCQMIAPIRATSLPTHYLWRNWKPTSKQLGPTVPEKIYWNVDTLLELVAFAHYMEVYWISDMVVDRLHWMFFEKKKLKESHAVIMQKHLEHVDRNKKMKKAAPEVPKMPELNCPNILPEDLDTDWLGDLVQDSIDVKTLTFIADLHIALGDKPDQAWLERQVMEVSDIFTFAEELKGDSTRAQFCEKYHHHGDEDTEEVECYTQYSESYLPALATLLREVEDEASAEQIAWSTKYEEDLKAIKEERETHTSPKASDEHLAQLATQEEDLSDMEDRDSGIEDGTPDPLHAQNMAKVREMAKRIEHAKMALIDARKNGEIDQVGVDEKVRGVMEVILESTGVLRWIREGQGSGE